MRAIILFLSMLAITINSFAQVTPEEEKKKMRDDFENFMKREKNKFKHYKDSVLNDYENFKKARWAEFKSFRTKGVFTEPKPKVMPPVNPNIMPLKPIPVAPHIPEITVKPRELTPIKDFEEKIEEKEKEKVNIRKIIKTASERLKIDFYGGNFYFFYQPISFSLYHLSQNDITEAVKSMSDQDEKFKSYLQQWIAYSKILQLNDYGFFQLVKKTAEKLYPENNKKTFFIWYVLNKSGFKSKLGFTAQGDCLLLLQSKYPLLNRYQFTIDDQKYYSFDFNPDSPKQYGSVYTYKGNPFNTKYQIDFAIEKVPEILPNQKINLFKLYNSMEKFELSSNISYMAFLNDMPMLDYQAYYYMPMSKKALERLDKAIKPHLKDKTPLQKVTFLLNFVQTSFPYQYDKEQFNTMERPLCAEEMLFYTKGDCEDHAALFAHLVLRYTNCDVMGILYPGHATTAVRFPDGKKIRGCHLPAPYADYVVCEPTCNMRTPVGYIHSRYNGVVPDRVFKVTKK